MTIINILDQEREASAEVQEQRKNMCATCEKYDLEKDSCAECSCLISRRVYYVEMFCPIGKW